jgi:hypothetical protein
MFYTRQFTTAIETSISIKQLLDEAEHDIKNYSAEVNVICRSEAEADNIDRGLNNS